MTPFPQAAGPIGVFDSGYGGLTILHGIRQLLPHHDFIYLGDNAASVDFWKWYVGELRKVKPDLYTVAEVWDAEGVIDQYIPAEDAE